MGGFEMFGIAVGVVILLLLIMNGKDLWRYIKISNM